MLSRHFPKRIKSARSYSSKPLIQLIPTENLFQFDGEKLTPEENKAAIPKRPNYEDVPKIHKDIPSPEALADLILQPDFNDTFFTSLSHKSPFLGDPSYKVILKDEHEAPRTLELLFANITTKYFDIFNKQTIQLKDIPLNLNDNVLSKTVHQLIETEIADYKSSNNVDQIDSLDHLNIIGERLRVLENTRKILSGDVDVTLATDLVTVEKFGIFLIGKLAELSQAEAKLVLEYLDYHMQNFNIEGLRRITETIIQASRGVTDKNVSTEYVSFVRQLLSENPAVLNSLSPAIINDAIGVFLRFDLEASGAMLKLLIETHLVKPDIKTLEEYLIEYDKKNYGPLRFIRDNHIIKPIILLEPLSPLIVDILLKNIVTDIELEHLLKVLCMDRNLSVLEQVSRQVVEQAINLESRNDQAKAIRVAQIIANLESKGINLELSKDLLLEFSAKNSKFKNFDKIVN